MSVAERLLYPAKKDGKRERSTLREGADYWEEIIAGCYERLFDYGKKIRELCFFQRALPSLWHSSCC